MASVVLAAAVGVLVGLISHAVGPARGRSPLWLTTCTGLAAAVLGTTAARLAGRAGSPLDSLPAVLLAPLFFAGLGVAVLTFGARRSARERR